MQTISDYLSISYSRKQHLSRFLFAFICLENERGVGIRNQTEAQSMAAMDNKHNIAQREQYYAAVHKDMATPTRDLRCMERIPGQTDTNGLLYCISQYGFVLCARVLLRGSTVGIFPRLLYRQSLTTKWDLIISDCKNSVRI